MCCKGDASSGSDIIKYVSVGSESKKQRNEKLNGSQNRSRVYCVVVFGASFVCLHVTSMNLITIAIKYIKE